ncbi:MAG: hypothetical protein IPM82_08270 [Saprospiraceae bacterium]|nr:hypothetical protein [Saprospiraceae bacterium]
MGVGAGMGTTTSGAFVAGTVVVGFDVLVLGLASVFLAATGGFLAAGAAAGAAFTAVALGWFATSGSFIATAAAVSILDGAEIVSVIAVGSVEAGAFSSVELVHCGSKIAQRHKTTPAKANPSESFFMAI